MIFKKWWLAALVVAVCLGAQGCDGDSSATPTNDTANTNFDLLDRFCIASVRACETVTLPLCMMIANDAGKKATQADLDFAEKTASCADTKVCLDNMGSGAPTTQPSP